MADTLKFGPEWLRQLSGGNSVGTPPPSPAPGFGKYKLADYRYGREEMLALYTRSEGVPEELQQFTPILSETAQDPLAFQPPSDEEQRILSQSVNSQAVLRMMGRGAPPSMRGRGTSIDRGRGRGRGRGDGFMQRGISYDEIEGGGFGRPRQRPDGTWDEGDPKAFQRPFQNRYPDTTQPNKAYQRSLSSENWRDREEDDDDNGDWRRAGSKWSNSRGSWRDSRNYDYDRSGQAGRGYNPRQYNRSRSGENWDEEDLPEWTMDGDPDELGTFDASGAFVSPRKGNRGEGIMEELISPRQNSAPADIDKEKVNSKGAASQKEKDINDNRTKKTDTKPDMKPDKSESPRPSTTPPKSNSAQSGETLGAANYSKKTANNSVSPQPSPRPVPKTEKPSAPQKSVNAAVSEKSQNKETSVDNKKPDKNKTAASTGKSVKTVDSKNKTVLESAGSSSKDSKTKAPPTKDTKEKDESSKNSKRREKLKSEAEALDQLQETAENMVAGITVLEDEDEDKEVSSSTLPVTKPQLGALPPDHEHYNKWFYRDPQGDLQGPFTSNEMAEWFSAGYFTMNLQVRRGCDEKFSPLGEMIKRWGRVPFLPGQSPPPFMNSVSPDPSQQHQQEQQQKQIQALQQQYLLQQQQLVQQHMLVRHLQLQQMQQIMAYLQENEQFKNLTPLQQQQLAMQMLAKKGTPTLPAQQSPQTLSPSRSSEAVTSTSPSPTSQPAAFNRSYSTPSVSQAQSSLPASIWDIDPSTITSMPSGGISATELEAQLKDKEAGGERKHKEFVERQKEELRKQQEELQRQKEEIERERLEMERQKQEEIMKIQEERIQAEQEKEKARIENEQRLRKLEEQRARQVEEQRRKLEQMEMARKQEEEERNARQMEEEMKRQKEIERQKESQRQQEMQKQQEVQRLREQEEFERRQEQQRQEEALRKQQQEALRKIQQEQLANMQLPSHAQWGSTASPVSNTTGKSLLEIQQQEETERLEREEMQRQMMEAQRQQMLALQQQQQQQQKSWTNTVSQPTGTKSLLEIQQEQARQLERERQKREENQQMAAKNLSLGAASVWASSPPVSNWANEGAWAAMKTGQQNSNNNNNNNGSLGFWDDAIISSSGPIKKQSGKTGKQATGDFPALGGGPPVNKTRPTTQQNKVKPSKSKKEEEAVQRLFQTTPLEDDFTQWCQKQLRNMATCVDIPTFISFLQDIDCPYEVHDYIRQYLGENKASDDFGKAYLEKRSQYRNKSKPVQDMDSIWGPAPAITPRELRQQNPAPNDDSQRSKANKKKKNKMMKVDASILGFTVHAAPDRIVGEIETVETNTR